MVRTANYRKSLECVERRRRRDRPFERSRCWAPGIVTSKPLLGKCVIKQVDEQNRSDAGKVGSEGGNPVPVSESVRIVNVAAWHARKAKEMLREESQVHTGKDHPEMYLPDCFVVHVTGYLREPIIEPSEDREYGCHR